MTPVAKGLAVLSMPLCWTNKANVGEHLTCASVNIDNFDSHGGTVVPALIHLPEAALP